MAEHIRNCAGGVVFAGDDVFLLKNDKSEWIMPKGVIRDRRSAREGEIVALAGRTSYDLYSQSRRKSVSNRIQWFAMRASDHRYRIAFEQGFLDGDYFPYEVAVRLLTHEQDREILRRARAILTGEAPQGE